jgi:hypothetical protein
MTSKISIRVIAIIIFSLLVGCAKETPKCSDEDTLLSLKKLIIEQANADTLFGIKMTIKNIIRNQANDQEIQDNVKFDRIKAVSFDEKIKKYSCEANLIAGNTYQLPITYESQLDDTDQHIITLTRTEFPAVDISMVANGIIKAVQQNRNQSKSKAPSTSSEQTATAEHPKEVASPINTDPSQTDQSDNIVMGRCHMNSCSWWNVEKTETVQSQNQENLLKAYVTNTSADYSDDEIDKNGYPNNPPKNSQWERGRDVFVLCSKTFPTYIEYDAEKKKFVGTLIPFDQDGVTAGFAESMANLYYYLCHTDGGKKFNVNNNFDAEIILDRPTDIFSYPKSQAEVQSQTKQTSSSEIPKQLTSSAVTPKNTDRYLVKGDLVTDTKTGIMWMRCSLGQNWDGSTCQGDAATYTWNKAMSVTNNFSYAGYNDWRLPKVQELKTLVYCSGGQPTEWNEAINTIEYDGCLVNYDSPTVIQDVFPNTPATWEWSSTPNDTDTNRAWAVNFGKGSAPRNGDKTGAVPVRLVRTERVTTDAPTTESSENKQPTASDQLYDSSEIPTTTEGYIQKMLKAGMIGDTGSVQSSRQYLDNLPKPKKGDKNVARKINEEGLKFIQSKQYDKAVPLFAKASQTDPSDVEILNNYGFSLMMSNNLSQAETVLIKTLIMKPDRTSAWSNLGYTFAFQGKEDMATASYMNAYQFSKKPEKTVEYFKQQLAQENNVHVKKALSGAIDEIFTDKD